MLKRHPGHMSDEDPVMYMGMRIDIAAWVGITLAFVFIGLVALIFEGFLKTVAGLALLGWAVYTLIYGYQLMTEIVLKLAAKSATKASAPEE